MKPQLVIDRLSISLDGVPGVDPHGFRQALARALRRMPLPQDIPDQTLNQITMPAIQAQTGDTTDRLAERTAQSLAQAIRRAAP